jgi:FkbM family methyltransferase
VALFSIASIVPGLPRIKIVDVGAADAIDAPAYAALTGALPCDVVGFEPQTAECEKLNAVKRPGHLYLPHAIGDGTQRTFYECNYPQCSSLFEPNEALASKFQYLAEPMRVVGTLTLQTRRLDDFPETAGADFLKIDVQGAELLVLEGAVKSLRDVLVVHVEVEFLPLYKDQPLFGDIDAFLRGHGFAFHTMIPFGRTFKPMVVGNDASASVRQILWADAVYVRDFMAFAELAPQSLLKLAAILHENYRSLDLAALALEAYDRKMGSGLQMAYLKRLSGR